MEKTLAGVNIEYLSAVFGAFDENIEIIEKECGVKIISRADMVSVTGEKSNVEHAESTLGSLFEIAKTRDVIDTQTVKYIISLSGQQSKESIDKEREQCI